MRLFAIALLLPAVAWAEEPSPVGEPLTQCVPAGPARLPRISDLKSLLEWAQDAFCHPIVAPAKQLLRPAVIDATADEIPPAEQQRRFRAAVERLGLQVDTSARVWKLQGPASGPRARPHCVPYPSKRKLRFDLRGPIDLQTLANMYEPMFCRPFAFPMKLGDRTLALFVPNGTLMTPPEFDAMLRDALRAAGAAFEEQRGLMVWDLAPDDAAAAPR